MCSKYFYIFILEFKQFYKRILMKLDVDILFHYSLQFPLGYFRLARNRNNHCNVASEAVFALV